MRSTPAKPGPVALVGGEEFLPGNEPHDELLVRAAGMLALDRPAFVIATAAARHGPERAVEHAVRWFAALGLEVEELPVRTRGRANSSDVAAMARRGRFFYLCGGDPGIGFIGFIGRWPRATTSRSLVCTPDAPVAPHKKGLL